MVSLALIIFFVAPVAAQGRQHWAKGPVQALLDKGISSEELRQALLTDSWQQLDGPISPLEWQNWVQQALAVGIGMDLANDEDLSFWVNTYTMPKHEGPRSVLSRGYGVAGLMKVGNLFGFIPGGREGLLVYLPRFSDWRQVEEKGFSEAWELMLEAGIVNGYPDGTLRSEVPLTRAEAACLLKAWLDVYNLETELQAIPTLRTDP